MESSDVFASLLQNPETMQKLAGIASELMGGMNTASADSSPSDNASAPALSELSESVGMSTPAPPELHASGESDPLSQLMLQAMPALSAIAQSAHNSIRPERRQLLYALKPFLSPHTCSQIDHAEHILSMARMTQSAAKQFIPQLYGREG